MSAHKTEWTKDHHHRERKKCKGKNKQEDIKKEKKHTQNYRNNVNVEIEQKKTWHTKWNSALACRAKSCRENQQPKPKYSEMKTFYSTRTWVEEKLTALIWPLLVVRRVSVRVLYKCWFVHLFCVNTFYVIKCPERYISFIYAVKRVLLCHFALALTGQNLTHTYISHTKHRG